MRSVLVAALVVVAAVLVYVSLPFSRAIPVGRHEHITAQCEPAITGTGRSRPDSLSSRHDRFRFVECRNEARMRLLKGSGLAVLMWFVAALAGARLRSHLPQWQRSLLTSGTVVAVVVASLATISFAVATLRNPYNDISRAYTTLLTLGAGATTLGLWIVFAVLRRRFTDLEEPGA